MRTTTREGYRLNVDPRVAGRIAPLLRTLGLERLVRSQLAGSPSRGDLRQATERSLAGLARRSRYSGVMLYPNSTRSFAVFTSPAAGGPYRLLARPTASGELEVAVAFSPAAEDIPEFAAQPVRGRGTVTWDSPVPLGQAIQANRGQQGLYVVETDLGNGQGWRPLYIGQGDIVGELRREIRATNHVKATNPQAQFRAYIGHRDGRSGLSQQQIETTLLRRASRAGPPLANDNHQYRRPMMIPAGSSVRLRHRGTPPPYLLAGGRRTQTLSGGPRSGRGRQYESFALMPATAVR
jgi:hypothetical protein